MTGRYTQPFELATAGALRLCSLAISRSSLGQMVPTGAANTSPNRNPPPRGIEGLLDQSPVAA
jgi:hypothetical protein